MLQVDATQLEINPLVETDDGRVVSVDAKINFDDCAKYRQEEIFALDDVSETDPQEVSTCLKIHLQSLKFYLISVTV